jgi:hypothetical protein
MQQGVFGAFRWSISAVACALLVLMVAGSVTAQEVRYRKHVDDMLPGEWQTLAAAIATMRQRDDMGTTPTPVTQRPDSYEFFVKTHGDIRVQGCEHASELIWFWHRAFLLDFENRLNAARPAGKQPDHASVLGLE